MILARFREVLGGPKVIKKLKKIDNNRKNSQKSHSGRVLGFLCDFEGDLEAIFKDFRWILGGFEKDFRKDSH